MSEPMVGPVRIGRGFVVLAELALSAAGVGAEPKAAAPIPELRLEDVWKVLTRRFTRRLSYSA